MSYNTIPYHTIPWYYTMILAPPYCIEFLRNQVSVLYVQYQYVLVVLVLYHLSLLTVITHCKIQMWNTNSPAGEVFKVMQLQKYCYGIASFQGRYHDKRNDLVGNETSDGSSSTYVHVCACSFRTNYCSYPQREKSLQRGISSLDECKLYLV